MALDPIDVGTLPNDGTGTPLRLAFQRVNANFQEIDGKLTDLFGSVPVAWSVNGAGHLILTLSDSGTVDTGYVIGPQGAPGATLRTGSGTPANTLGRDGDLYLNLHATTGTGDVYQRVSGAYGLVGNVRGAAGSPGAVWRSGSGAPDNGLGINGDFYLNTDTSDIYKRASGTYAIVVNIKGLTGDPGNTVLNGSGAPADTLGRNSDFYIDVANSRLYGPKASGVWPSGYVALIGPTGPAGGQSVTPLSYWLAGT